MSDLANQNQNQNQSQNQNLNLNRESEFDELSLTLIERRKRLHDLASEINQWQDESNKHLAGTPTAPPLPCGASPKTTIMGRSPSPYSSHYQSQNKENKTPTNSQPTVKRIPTPSSNEILTVAQRILSKRQSNVEPTVKSLRDKFESKQEECTEAMTPKSLIKKFEQLSSAGPALPTKKLAEKKSTTNFTPLGGQVKCEPTVNGHEDNKPRSIIQKFEQLMMKNGPKAHSTQQMTTYVSTNNSTSLTYVSSMQSSSENSSPECANEYFDYERDKPTPPPPHFMDGEGEGEGELTSLFERSSSGSGRQMEDDYEDGESMATSSYNTHDAYSISGSSYTGSIINQDEFDDEGENTTYDDDDDDDAEDEEDTHSQQETMQHLQTDDYDSISESQQYDGETTVSAAETVAPSPGESERTPTPASGSSSAATTTSSSLDTEPLFSLQEYRKQTRTMRHGRRRSSLMPRANANSTGGKDCSKTSRQATGKTANGSCLPTVCETSDDQNKKLKYLERMKELEEFIKQEDNVIYQTGIALEKCLTDAQFTGSSEHIECNRILLISCQKRQAFLTEVNRLKQLASNPHLQPNRSTSTNDAHSSNEAGDISSSDLTGLLIFSDLQLPIKESYINKLKCGDEKRLFYFICLIRNGIQVLQTQVISVQEIISTKENSITFPNRMAINNVDINFKVKIDIYAMEVLPKDTKTKQSTHSTHTSSKFFSPFKNNLFSSHSHNSNHQGNSHQNQNSQSSNSQHSSGISSLGAKTSNFIHIDTVEITNRDIYSNKFKLNISSSSIPLGGLLFVNVRCMPSKSIELKGFMTLFEDVNGLGSWDRRWCFLNNYSISYWKYPEDEYRNGPLGTINLTKCINESVSLLPRDLCARKHTIELIIYEVEPSHGQSINSSECADINKQSDKFKYKRFRLSADTKDQANDWLTNINYALANLRIWNPKAIKPAKK